LRSQGFVVSNLRFKIRATSAGAPQGNAVKPPAVRISGMTVNIRPPPTAPSKS